MASQGFHTFLQCLGFTRSGMLKDDFWGSQNKQAKTPIVQVAQRGRVFEFRREKDFVYHEEFLLQHLLVKTHFAAGPEQGLLRDFAADNPFVRIGLRVFDIPIVVEHRNPGQLLDAFIFRAWSFQAEIFELPGGNFLVPGDEMSDRHPTLGQGTGFVRTDDCDRTQGFGGHQFPYQPVFFQNPAHPEDQDERDGRQQAGRDGRDGERKGGE